VTKTTNDQDTEAIASWDHHIEIQKRFIFAEIERFLGRGTAHEIMDAVGDLVELVEKKHAHRLQCELKRHLDGDNNTFAAMFAAVMELARKEP